MAQLIVTISQLEWLHWGALGQLRVAPQRVRETNAAGLVQAVAHSMASATDLEPGDDAFLLCRLAGTPSFHPESGCVLLELADARFEAMSNRGYRLLEPIANRMLLPFSDATPAVEEAWSELKRHYASRVEHSKIQRLIRWSFASASDSPEISDRAIRSLYSEQRAFQSALKELSLANKKRFVASEGTNAHAWMYLINSLLRDQILVEGISAEWRPPVNAYVEQARNQRFITARFFPDNDPIFEKALEQVDVTRKDVEPLFVESIGNHHAHYISQGKQPDFEALAADLKTLGKLLAGTASREDLEMIAAKTIAILAASIPADGIATATHGSRLKGGWAKDLITGLTGAFCFTEHEEPKTDIETAASERIGVDAAEATDGSHRPEHSPVVAEPAPLARSDTLGSSIQSETNTGGTEITTGAPDENVGKLAPSDANPISDKTIDSASTNGKSEIISSKAIITADAVPVPCSYPSVSDEVASQEKIGSPGHGEVAQRCIDGQGHMAAEQLPLLNNDVTHLPKNAITQSAPDATEGEPSPSITKGNPQKSRKVANSPISSKPRKRVAAAPRSGRKPKS